MPAHLNAMSSAVGNSDDVYLPDSHYDSPDSQSAQSLPYTDIQPNHDAKYRKYKILFFAVVAILIGFLLLVTFTDANSPKKPFFTILQMNDVYELNAVGGAGGFPKVKTYHDQLLKTEKHLMTVLAGDFYSPSALGVARVKIGAEEEKPLHGRQIVDAMNHLGSKDFLVTWGNHEYDISEESFYSRIDESKFTYVSTNLSPAKGHKWPSHVVPYYFKKYDGITIAFVSLSILVDSNLPYIKQYEFSESIQRIRDTLESFKTNKQTYDILIAITHQSLADDSELIAQVPELDLVMGGHEHENWKINRSLNPKHPVYICKADANAKTVFKHSFHWDATKLAGQTYTPYGIASQVEGVLTIKSELVAMDHNIPEDPKMAEVTKYWTNLGFQAFIDKGLDPGRVMCHLTEHINAMDKVTRSTVSMIGSFMADSFDFVANLEYKVPESTAEVTYNPNLLTIFNIGSVRIDDYLVVGDLYEYDALRLLPFGGDIVVIEVTGQKLLALLDTIRSEAGTGMWMGFNPDKLHCPTSGKGLPPPGCAWEWHGKSIKENINDVYSVVTASYITSVGWNQWFDSKDDFKIVKETTTVDQQHALINHFGRVYPLKP